MTDLAALAAVRALEVLAVLIVMGRSLLRGSDAREVSRSRWQHVWIFYVVAFAAIAWHPAPLVTPSWYDATVRVAGVVAGIVALALLVWAYIAMGRYWDGVISARRDHAVVERGPFAIVRHPVYLAFDLAVAGAAIALADPVVAAIALIAFVLMYGRARAEEHFLEARLGDAYRGYRRRVRMFVPGIF